MNIDWLRKLNLSDEELLNYASQSSNPIITRLIHIYYKKEDILTDEIDQLVSSIVDYRDEIYDLECDIKEGATERERELKRELRDKELKIHTLKTERDQAVNERENAIYLLNMWTILHKNHSTLDEDT